jgi:hypothetical protein
VPRLEEVFADPDDAVEYKQKLDVLWRHGLVEAHESIRAAKAIYAAPVGWLLETGPGPTLQWLANLLLERAGLRIINALTDCDPRTVNLTVLRDFLLTRCRPELRAGLTASVGQVFTECDLGQVRSKVERHRHTLLAHHEANHWTRPEVRAQAMLTLRELDELYDRARRMLNALSVHARLGYDLHRLSDEDSMEFIVKTLLRTSHWLNLPEEQGIVAFKAFAEHWKPEERAVFREWRERFNLPAVEFPTEE